MAHQHHGHLNSGKTPLEEHTIHVPHHTPQPGDAAPALQLLHSIARGLSALALAATLLVGGPVADVQAKHRLTVDEQKTVDLFQKSTPSVVYITNLAVRYVVEWVVRRLHGG